MAYGLKIEGSDSNGSYVIADTEGSFKPMIVANVGQGTSVDLPSSGNYLLYANQKGLYGTLTNGATSLTATRVTTFNNKAYFWYCSDWTSNLTGMGTNTISATWSNTADCRYILITESTALTRPSGEVYGLKIDDSSGNEIFDSTKITINDSFRIRGSFTYDTPIAQNDTFNQIVITEDEDMFIEMAPFSEPKSSATAQPFTGAVCGPEFTSTRVFYSFSTPDQQFGKYYGSLHFGKLLYNPTNITAGKPVGWTQPY